MSSSISGMSRGFGCIFLTRLVSRRGDTHFICVSMKCTPAGNGNEIEGKMQSDGGD